VARARRPLTTAEKMNPCPRCGATPGERCKNPGGMYYGEYVHARRSRIAGPGAEYMVIACRNCRHPGGQHLIGSGCRLCRDCPGWEEGSRLAWSDRKTDELLAAADAEEGDG
jgi:hypothetical protein